jgi:hypothetical protein
MQPTGMKVWIEKADAAAEQGARTIDAISIEEPEGFR